MGFVCQQTRPVNSIRGAVFPLSVNTPSRLRGWALLQFPSRFLGYFQTSRQPTAAKRAMEDCRAWFPGPWDWTASLKSRRAHLEIDASTFLPSLDHDLSVPSSVATKREVCSQLRRASRSVDATTSQDRIVRMRGMHEIAIDVSKIAQPKLPKGQWLTGAPCMPAGS